MRVEGRFMQALFIEIHQVIAKKKVEYFSNKVVCCIIICGWAVESMCTDR